MSGMLGPYELQLLLIIATSRPVSRQRPPRPRSTWLRGMPLVLPFIRILCKINGVETTFCVKFDALTKKQTHVRRILNTIWIRLGEIKVTLILSDLSLARLSLRISIRSGQRGEPGEILLPCGERDRVRHLRRLQVHQC